MLFKSLIISGAFARFVYSRRANMNRVRKTSLAMLAAALVTQSGVSGQSVPARRGAPAPAAATLGPRIPNPGRDWMYHGGEPGGTRFSTLTQINTENVKGLTRAWTF